MLKCGTCMSGPFCIIVGTGIGLAPCVDEMAGDGDELLNLGQWLGRWRKGARASANSDIVRALRGCTGNLNCGSDPVAFTAVDRVRNPFALSAGFIGKSA
jgi:hypothetical protein